MNYFLFIFIFFDEDIFIDIYLKVKKICNLLIEFIHKELDNHLYNKYGLLLTFSLFGLVSLFNGIWTFVGYLMPKLFS